MTDLNVYYKCGDCGRDRRELASGLRSKSQVKKEEAVELILDCPTCASALYKIFREETGYCETCQAGLDTHKKCYLCGILLGHGHESEGVEVGDKATWKDLWCGSCCKQRHKGEWPATCRARK